MNKNRDQKENILESSLKEMGKSVFADSALLTSILNALPGDSKVIPIKSPYFNYIKISISSLAVILLAAGGIYLNQYHSATVSQNSISDASLNQDLSSIDTQMNGLNADTAAINQGLNSTQ